MGIFSALMKGAAVGLMGFEVGQKISSSNYHTVIHSRAQYNEVLIEMESSIIVQFFIIGMMLIITSTCFSMKCYNKISERLSFRPTPAARSVTYTNNCV